MIEDKAVIRFMIDADDVGCVGCFPMFSFAAKLSTSIVVQVSHVQLPLHVTLHIDGKSIVYPPLITHTPLSCVALPTLKLLPASSTAFPFALHEVGAMQTLSNESEQTITSSLGSVNCVAVPSTIAIKAMVMHRMLKTDFNNGCIILFIAAYYFIKSKWLLITELFQCQTSSPQPIICWAFRTGMHDQIDNKLQFPLNFANIITYIKI